MVKKKKPRRMWIWVPPEKPKPKVPNAIKQQLTEEANQLIETVLKPKYLELPPTDNDFNYIADIYSRWYRNYFYFIAQYNCPSPEALAPSFESKYVRLEYVDENKFNLAYMRYNNQWCETHHERPMMECLNLVKGYLP
jgi:hypothetical protein